MEISHRRRFFLGQCGAIAVALVVPGMMLAATTRQQRYYSARADLEGRYYVSAMNVDGGLLFDTPLPARAHAIATRPGSSEILVFARRPGYFIMVLDAVEGTVKRQIDVSSQRPLFGHGIFSRDGRYLFTSENDVEEGRGIIGVRDAADGYRRIDEFSSGGVGPHELCLLRDGSTLIDDFRLAKEQHQLSIRHLHVNDQDQVCFAMQYQGPKSHRLPLVGFHRGEESLQLAEMPADRLSAMKNYCGSVCTDISGEWFAVSAPRGNLVTLWSADGTYAASIPLNDGSGLAAGAMPGEFILSSGGGKLLSYRPGHQPQPLFSDEHYRWDNHMVGFSV